MIPTKTAPIPTAGRLIEAKTAKPRQIVNAARR
jgi:hypothetical protein